MNTQTHKVTTFGERLKLLRIQKGLSQTELGNAVDTHYSQIGRYERGQAKPSADGLKFLAEQLGVSTDYLYDGIEEDAAIADLEDRNFLKYLKKQNSSTKKIK